jgi:CBS domain-containing protein
MTDGTTPTDIRRFLETVHPYDALGDAELDRTAAAFALRRLNAGDLVYGIGEALAGLYLIADGEVEIADEGGQIVSVLRARNSFGERGLQRGGSAMTEARTTKPTDLLVLPRAEFHRLVSDAPAFARFFDRSRPAAASAAEAQRGGLATRLVSDLIAGSPQSVAPDTPLRTVAERMRDAHVSSLAVTEGDRLVGIVTTRDMATKAVAGGLAPDTPVSAIMTADPVTLPPTALGTDVLHVMMERGIGHLPVTDGGRLVGVITQTDLTRFQALSSAAMIRDIARAADATDIAEATARLPQLLLQLVAGGNRHEVVTRLITDVSDAATRRLLRLAEDRFGPPPVRYLWLACGSQGRQEQTGVSDQDNCLMLDDTVTDDDLPYFDDLARFVSDGLDTAGYFYCPGDMMATNSRWRQPVRRWRDYFRGWIARPDPMAQMLASVMFDLRPIGGATQLFDDLEEETLAAAQANSIFVSHMIVNSLKHTPPLGLLRGFATIRSGEHKNQLDLKHNGVVPVVDLARVYALRGRVTAVNTRARLVAADLVGFLGRGGAADLLDAYDLIAQTRLQHQADDVRAGRRPDNFMPPAELSEFERSHLRDAFVVIRTMQNAMGHGRGMLS